MRQNLRAVRGRVQGDAGRVVDPDESLKRAYRVVGRPFTWFIDRSGVIQDRQISGPMTDEEFQRHYDRICAEVTAPTEGEPAIIVDGVAKRYGTRMVVDDVSLEVRPGEVVALRTQRCREDDHGRDDRGLSPRGRGDGPRLGRRTMASRPRHRPASG